jgi:hypothetical protein
MKRRTAVRTTDEKATIRAIYGFRPNIVEIL